MVQCLFAVAGFKRQGVSNFKLSILLSAPALAGAGIGARIAVDMPDVLFKRVLAIIMLLVLGFTLWNTRHRNRHKGSRVNLRNGGIQLSGCNHLVVTMIVFFFVGLYGGFIQVGVGFIIIAALTSITGLGLIETNSHKVFISGIYTILALIVFVFNGKVCWTIGFGLATGMGLGGWVGSHWAVLKGERWIRVVLIMGILAMVIKLFGLWPV